jgi:hypothetical protein
LPTIHNAEAAQTTLLIDKIITGAPKIAKFLRVSRITVLRMIDGKRLAAFKTGGNTSPWKCWLSEIERVRRCEVDQHRQGAE